MPVYSAIYDGPPNGYTKTYTKKRYIAIHNTSNDAPAVNEASYAKRRTDGVSSHYYVDDERVIQSLNTDYKAWHAGSSTGNSYAIAYEIVGTNSRSRDWWLSNVDWDKLAKQISTDMKQWGIKNQHLTVSQMRDGSSTGIVTHDDMRRAWGGTTHTDPGSNFPMDRLIKKINEYLNPVQEEFVMASKEEVKDALREVVRESSEFASQGLGNQNPTFKPSDRILNEYTWSDVKGIREEVKALTEKVDKLTVSGQVSDEQLERVLRKVVGSVDNVS